MDKRWEILGMPEGIIIKDWFEDGVRCLIMRGPAHLCAYLGVPINHPLAGYNYDEIPLRVHGGLTFADKGDGKNRPTGYWWYGWDYGHAGDATTYEIELYGKTFGKMWTIAEVEEEVHWALYDFAMVVKLA